MTSFPVLRFPLLAQLEVLKHVELLDLIAFSFCSQRTRRLVEEARVQLDDVGFDFFGAEMFHITVNTNFDIYCFQDSQAPRNSEQRDNVLWEALLTDNRTGQQVSLFQGARTLDGSRKLLIKHIMETFRRVKAVSIENDKLPMLTLPIWKYTKTLKKLRISPETDETLEEEEIKFIFEELSVNELLNFDIPVIGGFRFSRGFHQKSVSIHPANWVKFDAILNSTSESIVLEGIEKPSAAQLNTLLKSWMSMDTLSDLKYTFLSWPQGSVVDRVFRTNVFDGIVVPDRFNQETYIERIDGEIAEVTIEDNEFGFIIIE